MDKETLLHNYVEIETNTFNKLERSKKLDELFKNHESWKAKFTSTDIIEIIDYLANRNIKIRLPLYQHLIHPILSAQVEQNNVNAIKALLRLDLNLAGYVSDLNGTKFSGSTLLEKGLSISPDDRELLELSENWTSNYLNYSIHELPTGIIYDSNGATIEQCDELIKEVEKYELLCSRLERDESQLIAECKFYYAAYKAYLSVFKNYKNFADYLNKESERPK